MTDALHKQQESWLYFPPRSDAGFQQLKVCDESGYDFARLVWKVCPACRMGLLAKIRVTDGWTRRGYGTRMVRRAVRGLEAYTWRTTTQSDLGKLFFPSISEATGIEFCVGRGCEHMRAGRRYSGHQIEEQPMP